MYRAAGLGRVDAPSAAQADAKATVRCSSRLRSVRRHGQVGTLTLGMSLAARDPAAGRRAGSCSRSASPPSIVMVAEHAAPAALEAGESAAGHRAEIRESAGQVLQLSRMVATSSQSLSQGATEQAASLEETSASMEEMASMTRKNAENAAAGDAARDRRRASRCVASNVALGEMVASMTRSRSRATRSRRSSRRSTRSPSRPTSSRSTRRSRRRAPARPAWASRSSPTRSATWRSARRRRRGTRPDSSRNPFPVAGGRRQGATGRVGDPGHHASVERKGHCRGRARVEPPADAGHRPGVAGDRADGEGDPDHGRHRGGERRGQRGAERAGRSLQSRWSRSSTRVGANAMRGRRRTRRPPPRWVGRRDAGRAAAPRSIHSPGEDGLAEPRRSGRRPVFRKKISH